MSGQPSSQLYGPFFNPSKKLMGQQSERGQSTPHALIPSCPYTLCSPRPPYSHLSDAPHDNSHRALLEQLLEVVRCGGLVGQGRAGQGRRVGGRQKPGRARGQRGAR